MTWIERDWQMMKKIMFSDRRNRYVLIISICVISFINFECSPSKDQASENISTITVLSGGADNKRGIRYLIDTLVFLPLARFNEKGELVGKLAESWEHSADYRTWKIHLRRNVRWSDGVPVTAHDIKFTIDLWNHPNILENRRIESVTVLDDNTLTITYKKIPLWALYWLPGLNVICYPKHLLKDLDPAEYYDWEFWKNPVGNGPYRLVHHVPKTVIEFEANPNYYRGKPKIERVLIKFGSTVLTELLAGNVDATSRISKMDALKIDDDPRFRIYYQVWDDILQMTVILWNQHHLIFRDPQIRRALTMAINRQELPSVLHMAKNLPVTDAPYTSGQYWRGELSEPLPYDPENAEDLLENAGWNDLDGDGVREKDGQEFSFKVIVAKRWEAAAVYVQSHLSKVGVKMEIFTLNGAVLRNRVREGDFEAAITYVENNFLRSDGLHFFCSEGSPIGFHNPQISEGFDIAKKTMNPDEIDAVFQELMPIFQAELPWTFLTLDVETYLAHRKIKGLSSPFRANPVYHMENLWIEEE
jgi:peptide/nickel transport system substrate-binding protein